MVALSRSTEEFKYIYRNEKFVGVNAIVSLIVFGQHFLQGLGLEAESFEQLCLHRDENDKVYKKKKQKKITNLKHLMESEEDK